MYYILLKANAPWPWIKHGEGWPLALGKWLASSSFSHCVPHLSASPKLAIILNHQGRRETWDQVNPGLHGYCNWQAATELGCFGPWKPAICGICFWDLLVLSQWTSPIYNLLLSVLFLPLRNILNLSTVSLQSLSMLQATTSWPPTFLCWFSSCWSPYLCPCPLSL